MMTIAIDPGATGGIVVAKDDEPVRAIPMPGTPWDIYALLFNLTRGESIIPNPVPCRAIMEKVGMHRLGNNASTSCKLARHCGHIEMALLALSIPFEEPTPQRWMKALGAMPKDKIARKNHIQDMMQRRYPHLRVTLWNADALGILTWALERDKT